MSKADLLFLLFQPVGFVTFSTRAGAESAKQDLQVSHVETAHSLLVNNSLKKLNNQQSTHQINQAFGRKTV